MGRLCEPIRINPWGKNRNIMGGNSKVNQLGFRGLGLHDDMIQLLPLVAMLKDSLGN